MNALAYESNATEELADLVLAAQDGDRAAFGELAVRYERMVYNVALARLANHAEAQELCQEVFMHALEKIDQLREPECFGGWLRSMAQRMAINRAMRRQPFTAAEAETQRIGCRAADAAGSGLGQRAAAARPGRLEAVEDHGPRHARGVL